MDNMNIDEPEKAPILISENSPEECLVYSESDHGPNAAFSDEKFELLSKSVKSDQKDDNYDSNQK